MSERTPFPTIFWVANLIEVLERFAYYGIYFGFGIYMEYLGYTRAQLGIVQSLFLFLSYIVPVVSGSFADRYGFKKVLIVSYVAYLPSILLLIFTRSFSGIALTMLSIGLAAGVFKPLIAGTVRAVTDKTNKTLGFGVFYAMVNVGGSFGPIVAGKLRAVSWNYAFIASALAIGFMLLITVFFYKEPERQTDESGGGAKLGEILTTLFDPKFGLFLVLLGLFFWLPFWAFFNLCAIYVDRNIDTARLYLDIRSAFGLFGASFGAAVADFFSREDGAGGRRILGETISHTGYMIMILQIFVSRFIEKFRPLPSFMTGLLVSAVGFGILGLAHASGASLVFLGIFFFAVGEMISSPRIQEYITWIAPKEKAGLYMGANYVATAIGALLSGVTYTVFYGWVRERGHPEYVWFVLGGHLLVAVAVFFIFTRVVGEFEEREE